MAIDEQRLRVRRSLEEKLGVEEASYLMDRPIGGWSDLVTNHTLDLKIEALRHELIAEMERRFRIQTWSMITAIFTAMGLLGAFLKL